MILLLKLENCYRSLFQVDFFIQIHCKYKLNKKYIANTAQEIHCNYCTRNTLQIQTAHEKYEIKLLHLIKLDSS